MNPSQGIPLPNIKRTIQRHRQRQRSLGKTSSGSKLPETSVADEPSSSGYSSLADTTFILGASSGGESNGRDIDKTKETAIRSLGYYSVSGDIDLDESLSNLSIDEGPTKPSTSRQASFRLPQRHNNGDDKGPSPFLSLNDLKMSNIKASVKIHNDIQVVLPSHGYTLPPRMYDYQEHLENIISIETSSEIHVEQTFMKAGMRICQVSPIISIQPCEVKFCSLYPAVVQVPSNLDLDPSAGDEVFVLHSKSSISDLVRNYSHVKWSSGMTGECFIKEGKVNFDTFQFGMFVLVVRAACVYSSIKQTISAEEGGRLVIPEFPTVQIIFPKRAAEVDIVGAEAKIYLDTEESISSFLKSGRASDSSDKNCLATPILQLEPHGSTFKSIPVMVTLPVPDYDKIISLLGSYAKLTILQSNTHSSETSKWQELSVEYEISSINYERGKSMVVITFPVSHFSFFKVMWNTLSEYLMERRIGMYCFYVYHRMKCHANMQEYANRGASAISGAAANEDGGGDDKGGRGFGLQVLMYNTDTTSPPPLSAYQHNVGRSLPKLVRPGKVVVKLKSNYFGPDLEVDASETLEEELTFDGEDIETQHMCKS